MTKGLTADMYNAQSGVITRQNSVLGEMKDLAAKAATVKDQGELMKIQQDLDDLKRNYDILKQG